VRSALGLGARLQTPLVKKPGILWESTNVAVGFRDIFGYVNNNATVYVEVTPIAVFKIAASFSHDYFIVNPFSGGVRTLTPLGVQKLHAGQVGRGDPNKINWVDKEGKDDTNNFTAPIAGDGFRVRLQPTLQGQLGPVQFQYNFAIDYNHDRAGNYAPDTVFHDTYTFSLRKLHDVGIYHEALVVYQAPISSELKAGVVWRDYRIFGTGLERMELYGLVFFRPPRTWWKGRWSPFAALQMGTNLRDPMHAFDFAWVSLVGIDFKVFG